jgi:hypothetical protein
MYKMILFRSLKFLGKYLHRTYLRFICNYNVPTIFQMVNMVHNSNLDFSYFWTCRSLQFIIVLWFTILSAYYIVVCAHVQMF